MLPKNVSSVTGNGNRTYSSAFSTLTNASLYARIWTTIAHTIDEDNYSMSQNISNAYQNSTSYLPQKHFHVISNISETTLSPNTIEAIFNTFNHYIDKEIGTQKRSVPLDKFKSFPTIPESNLNQIQLNLSIDESTRKRSKLQNGPYQSKLTKTKVKQSTVQGGN